MSLKAFFSCKKLRRSSRLIDINEKNLSDSLYKKKFNGNLGIFEMLPLEMIYLILRFLSIEELSLLTLTSKAMRNLVETYRISKTTLKKFFPIHLTQHASLTPEQQILCLKQFQRLGIFMKRSTCLYATKDRLKMIKDFISELECNRKSRCHSLSQCLALRCYGRFIHTVIAGWDETECYRVFEAINSSSRISKAAEFALLAQPGSHKRLELIVRLFYRRVFLDEYKSPKERMFWLSRILKPWSMIHQAKLLFIIYGPMCADVIQWSEVTENVAANLQEAKQHFIEMASAIQLLFLYKDEWSQDDILGIVEEIIGVPDDWLPENIATLLYLCGEQATLLVLGNKAINGRMTEVTSLIISLTLVYQKFGENIEKVFNLSIKIFDIIKNKTDRTMFWFNIADAFREVIMDICNFNGLENEVASDLRQILEANTEFVKYIIIASHDKII